MPDIRTDVALASGRITRELIRDNIVDLAMLQADPAWERDPTTDIWHRRTPEFFAARAETEGALPAQQEAAEIALGVVLLALESDLPHQEDGPSRCLAPNRMAYTIVSSDQLREGEFTHGHPTSSEAIAAWKRILLGYATMVDGDTLWWRTRPEVLGRIRFGETEARWFVYSRLMIGNEADTLKAQLKSGQAKPTAMMLLDGLISEDDLIQLGYDPSYLDPFTGEWRRYAVDAP